MEINAKLVNALLDSLTLEDIEELKKKKQEQLGILKPKPMTKRELRKEHYKQWLLSKPKKTY